MRVNLYNICRSYYRCTSASCNVKKRVERSFTDPSVVVTTYEGQHTHPNPVIPRSTLAGAPIPPGVSATNYLSQFQHHHQQLLFNTLSSLSFPNNYNNDSTPSRIINDAFHHQERRLCNLRDHGLLQDVVPSHMLKEE